MFGGDLLPAEVTVVPGKGKLTLTGKLGDVMQESAQAALSYVRSAPAARACPDFQAKVDIHIHFPEGAIPKDGPSAPASPWRPAWRRR
jgi:ATP-dependent Lon protease